MTKFTWSYRYVPDGQLEPDEYGRWALDCYMHVHIEKALAKDYIWLKETLGKAYMPVRVATIFQKGSTVGSVPSVRHRFCVNIPNFKEAGNFGFTYQSNFFSNDLDELKATVEEGFEQLRTVFKHCRNI